MYKVFPLLQLSLLPGLFIVTANQD